MKITLLGHASLLVESTRSNGEPRVLIDPVFFDPFEGDAVSCPRREVHVDALPGVDAVILSHAHRDHFDPPSLRRLSRQVRVFCPPDEELVYALRREGFSKVQVFEPWQPRSVGSLELIGTPSRDPLEQGILLQDGGVSFWNQVDTVVTQATCVSVLEACGGQLDAAICTYQPLIEYGLTWTSEAQFPRERYERLLEMALCCQAGVLLPGSAGLRMGGARAWCNSRMFPATREGFVRDIQNLEPAQAVEILNPGDAVTFSERGYERGSSAFATTQETDTQRVAFQPGVPVPALEDPNPWGYDPRTIDEATSIVVEQHFAQHLRAALTYRLRGPLRTLWDRRAVVEIEVCTPTGMRSWHISAWEPEAQLVRGSHPAPDYVFSYLGSEIVALTQDEDVERPTLRIRRRRGDDALGARLHTLDPARLHGVDLYFTVDEEYLWNPLAELIQAVD